MLYYAQCVRVHVQVITPTTTCRKLCLSRSQLTANFHYHTDSPLKQNRAEASRSVRAFCCQNNTNTTHAHCRTATDNHAPLNDIDTLQTRRFCVTRGRRERNTRKRHGQTAPTTAVPTSPHRQRHTQTQRRHDAQFAINATVGGGKYILICKCVA